MNGYSFKPWFRSVPLNGCEREIDFRAAFRDIPNIGYTKLTLKHDPILDSSEDVNREDNTESWGFRMSATVSLEIYDVADFPWLAGIVTRLGRTRDCKTYFSLDAGASQDRVSLRKWRGPDAIKGKTYIGGSFELEVAGVKPVIDIPLLSLQTNALTTYYARDLPPAGLWNRGQIWLREGIVGVREDASFESMQGLSGSYDWQPVTVGGP